MNKSSFVLIEGFYFSTYYFDRCYCRECCKDIICGVYFVTTLLEMYIRVMYFDILKMRFKFDMI